MTDHPSPRPGVEGSDEEVVAYFGYGSLINRATHRTEIVTAVPARLKGWRRTWRPRPDMPGFPAALLSVRREPGAVCDGLLVVDRLANLPAVDEREGHYTRVRLADGEYETAEPFALTCPVYVYEADSHVPAHPEPPRILQSYLDAVLQGVFLEYGEEGVRRFIDETDGFETAILIDREKPTYPRAVILKDEEQRLFDALLAGRGVVYHET